VRLISGRASVCEPTDQSKSKHHDDEYLKKRNHDAASDFRPTNTSYTVPWSTFTDTAHLRPIPLDMFRAVISERCKHTTAKFLIQIKFESDFRGVV